MYTGSRCCVIITSKMGDTGVQFNDKFQLPNSPLGGGKTSKMAGWVIKFSGGLIKDERQANYLLLAVVVMAVIVTILNFRFSGGVSSDSPSQEEVPLSDRLPPD